MQSVNNSVDYGDDSFEPDNPSSSVVEEGVESVPNESNSLLYYDMDDFPTARPMAMSITSFISSFRTTACDIMCTLNTSIIATSLKDSDVKPVSLPYKHQFSLKSESKGSTPFQKLKLAESHRKKHEEFLEERREYFDRLYFSRSIAKEIANQSKENCNDPETQKKLANETLESFSKKPISCLEIQDELCNLASKLGLKPIAGLNLEPRSKTFKRRFKIENAASFRIQRFFRMILERKKARFYMASVRTGLIHKHAKVVTRFFRFIIIKNFTKKCDVSKRHAAAIIIQCFVRKYLAKLKVADKRLKKRRQYRVNEATIIINRFLFPILSRLVAVRKQHEAEERIRQEALHNAHVIAETEKLATRVANSIVVHLSVELIDQNCNVIRAEMLEKVMKELEEQRVIEMENRRSKECLLMAVEDRGSKEFEDQMKTEKLRYLLFLERQQQDVELVMMRSEEKSMMEFLDCERNLRLRVEKERLELERATNLMCDNALNIATPLIEDDLFSFALEKCISDRLELVMNRYVVSRDFVRESLNEAIYQACGQFSSDALFSDAFGGIDDDTKVIAAVENESELVGIEKEYCCDNRSYESSVNNDEVIPALNVNDDKIDELNAFNKYEEVAVSEECYGQSTAVEETENCVDLQSETQPVNNQTEMTEEEDRMSNTGEIMSASINEEEEAYSHSNQEWNDMIQNNDDYEMNEPIIQDPLCDVVIGSELDETHNDSMVIASSEPEQAQACHSCLEINSDEANQEDEGDHNNGHPDLIIFDSSEPKSPVHIQANEEWPGQWEAFTKAYRKGQWDVAEKVLSDLEQLWSSTEMTSCSESVDKLIQIRIAQGDLFRMLAQYSSSKARYETVFDTLALSESFSSSSAWECHLYQRMANLFVDLGRYEESDQYFTRAIKSIKGILQRPVTPEMSNMENASFFGHFFNPNSIVDSVSMTSMNSQSISFASLNSVVSSPLISLYFEVLISQAQLQRMQGKFSLCLMTLQKIRTLSSKYSMGNMLKCAFCEIQGLLFQSGGYYAQSMALFEQMISIYSKEADYGEECPSIINVYIQMSNLCWLRCDYDGFVKYLELSQALICRYYASTHPKLADIKELIAFNFSRCGKFSECHQALEEALEIRKSCFGDLHPLTMKTWRLQGDCYQREGLPKLADDSFREAVIIQQSWKSEDAFLSIADLQVSVALNSLIKGDFILAKEDLEAAWKMLEEMKRSMEIGLFHQLEILNLSRCEYFLSLGRFEDCRQLLSVCSQNLTQIFGKNQPHWSLAKALGLLGRYCMEVGNYRDAENSLKRSMVIYKALEGGCSLSVVSVLLDCACNSMGPGYYTQAEKYVAQASSILEQIVFSSPDHNNLIWGQFWLCKAELSRDQEDFKSSTAFYDKAFAVFEECCSIDHHSAEFWMSKVTLSRAELLRRQKDLAEASNCIEKSIAVLQTQLSNPHPTLAYAGLLKAMVAYDAGQFEICESLLQNQVIPDMEACWGSSSRHPLQILAKGHLGMVCNAVIIQKFEGENQENNGLDDHSFSLAGQNAVDEALEWFDLYPQGRFADQHPWVKRLGGFDGCSVTSEGPGHSLNSHYSRKHAMPSDFDSPDSKTTLSLADRGEGSPSIQSALQWLSHPEVSSAMDIVTSTELNTGGSSVLNEVIEEDNQDGFENENDHREGKDDGSFGSSISERDLEQSYET